MFKKVRTYIYIVLVALVSLSSLFFFNKIVKGKDSPYISVIVPVYNTEKYLPRCLDSLVNQTYKDIEIICINDGSKDNSLNVLNDYAKKDKRIKVINQENQGVSCARNAGIDKSKGKYISFIDSDDYVDLDMYETLINSLKDKEYDILAFGYDLVDPKTGESKKGSDIQNGIFDACEFLDFNYNLQGVVNTLYKKSIIDENRLRFTPSVSYGEDILFRQMYILKVEKMKMMNRVFYHYVYDDEAAKQKYTNDKIISSAIERGKAILKFCSSNKITNKYKWALGYSIDLMHGYILQGKKRGLNIQQYTIDALKVINNKEFEKTLKEVSKDIIDKVNELKSFIYDL